MSRMFAIPATRRPVQPRERPDCLGPALTLLLAAVLSACAGAPRTSTILQVTDPRTFVEWAMSRGGMWVDIRGEPYAVPRPELEQTVVAGMTEAVSWTAEPRFTTDPDEAGGGGLRIVWTFNAGASGRSNCATPPPGGGPRPDGEVTIVATLCDGGDPLSHVNGRVVAPDGLDDPAFAALIRQVTRDLLPPPQVGGNPGIRMDR